MEKKKNKKFVLTPKMKKLLKIAVIILAIILIILVIWFAIIYPQIYFKGQEEKLDKGGKRYFEINSSYLPREEGRVITVSLETLAQHDYVEELTQVYSNKRCDYKNSNVKVVKRNGENEYYTYLKCGNYESSVDHEGPKITLNGDKEMDLSRGDTYEEPGVKSVIDNVDGEMDIASVTIEGKVDTSKVGTYTVTYTVSDSLNNTTVVERTINVSESLSSIVEANTENGYYQGAGPNNYIMFSHMLFRIVGVSEDDTITLVSADPVSNVDYSSEDGRFIDSSLDDWLNDYFYSLLDDDFKKIIVNSKWCDDQVTAANYNTTECNRYSDERQIGILSLQDYNLSLQDNLSYLDASNMFWLANFNESNNPWTLFPPAAYPEKIEAMSGDTLFNIRPALRIDAHTKVLSGTGTAEDPYIIIEKNSGRRNALLNTRHIGEYVNYSGYTFRIAGIDHDQVELIMTGTLSDDQGVTYQIRYDNGDNDKVYNPEEEGNIGYQIVNTGIEYIDTKLLVNKEITVPIYEGNITYQGKKTTKKYKARISIPSTFDIFSAKTDNSGPGYWLIDSSTQANTKAIVFPIGTIPYTGLHDYEGASVKLKIYIDKDAYLTGGDGTEANPYTISK